MINLAHLILFKVGFLLNLNIKKIIAKIQLYILIIAF